MTAHEEMLEAVREVRERVQHEVQKLSAKKLSLIAAGVRNLAQPVLLSGEEDGHPELVDVARRMVEIADALEGRSDVVDAVREHDVARSRFDPREHAGLCPDCFASLPADGSCCDECGWILASDMIRRRSRRPTFMVLAELRRRGFTTFPRRQT